MEVIKWGQRKRYTLNIYLRGVKTLPQKSRLEIMPVLSILYFIVGQPTIFKLVDLFEQSQHSSKYYFFYNSVLKNVLFFATKKILEMICYFKSEMLHSCSKYNILISSGCSITFKMSSKVRFWNQPIMINLAQL